MINIVSKNPIHIRKIEPGMTKQWIYQHLSWPSAYYNTAVQINNQREQRWAMPGITAIRTGDQILRNIHGRIYLPVAIAIINCCRKKNTHKYQLRTESRTAKLRYHFTAVAIRATIVCSSDYYCCAMASCHRGPALALYE